MLSPTGRDLKEFMRKRISLMTLEERELWGMIWYENFLDFKAGKTPRHDFYGPEEKKK